VSDNPYRLPRTASPTRYDLLLVPDLPAGRFTGTVDVALDVMAPTDELVCNAVDLEIDAAAVRVAGQEMDATTKLEEATERLHLSLPATLPPGPATLHLEFRGTLNDLLRGFYRSTFTDGDGNGHVIATTQMEATDCRRAFPCWDEPGFKAVFSVTLDVAEGLFAISNGPEIGRTAGAPGRVRVRFADTMPMSTYLAAFVVGPLQATPPVDVDGIPLRVVHVPGKGHLAPFALEVGAFALRYFQEYYGIPYPEKKVDLVALPDFAFGAMENPGCITFRETALLVDSETATQQDRQRIADVVSHELAHMWFGDLVTMKWWNGIWLNEAFATFMEVAACDAFRPEWKRWTSFGLERTAAFEIDALKATRSVEYEVVSPADAEGMFDVLTYEKGGSLLRMLEQYLGTPRFRDGVRHYLTTHAYANTETSDLWDAIEGATGEPARKMMDSWIWQGGYPLVSATRSADRQSLVLTQQRFLFSGDDDGTRWIVPVHVRQAHGDRVEETKILIEGDEARLPLIHPDATVVVNAGANGFLRVAYSDDLLGRLAGATLSTLSTAERYSLVDDAWASVVAGRLTGEAYCTFVRGFGDDRDLPVWEILLAGLGWIDRFVEGDARERFRRYVRALVAPALERLGWEPQAGEDELTGELRGTLIRALAVLGADPVAVDRARTLHQQSVADPASVHPAIAAAALSVVASTGDSADYDGCVARYQAARNPQDQRRELFALADFQPPELFERTLAFAFTDDVRTQDAPILLARCIVHRDHGATAWRFVRDHWTAAKARFPSNLVVRVVEPVSRLSRPEEQADVAAFLAEHPLPQAAKRVAQVLERQQVNVELRQREEPVLAHAFE
jgi:puromycin-sensitive aminopeptidase